MNVHGVASLLVVGMLLTAAARAQEQPIPVEALDEELLDFIDEWAGGDGEIIYPLELPFAEEEVATAAGDDHE